MVNYQNGKIYRIDGGGLTYIGSTTKKYLCDRLSGHKTDYKRYLDGKGRYITSFEVLKTDDYKIELIECFPCNSKDELTAREGYYIRQMDCVNKVIPGRTQKEYRENNKETISARQKQYRESNREAILEKHKQYYNDNKEQKLEYQKQYQEDNKEVILEKQKQYREKNKEAILAWRNQKHTCECGGRYTSASKSRHLKTSKHLNYLKDIKE